MLLLILDMDHSSDTLDLYFPTRNKNNLKKRIPCQKISNGLIYLAPSMLHQLEHEKTSQKTDNFALQRNPKIGDGTEESGANDHTLSAFMSSSLLHQGSDNPALILRRGL